MRLAVTGAAGHVGRAVVEVARAEGHDVVAIDRETSSERAEDIVVLDLADYSAVVGAFDGCDALIHLAAIIGPDRDPDHVVHDNNVVSSYHALRGAVEVGMSRICQASSINAIGGRFSRIPRYDYFPLDELHPPYPEDPYSLSKLICEQQADAIVRRFESVSIASLRLHGVVDHRDEATQWMESPAIVQRQLWGYTVREAAARAFLLGVTAPFAGHEVCYIVAPDTMADESSNELSQRHYPDVPLRQDLGGNRSFFDSSKAARVLGWTHDAGGSP